MEGGKIDLQADATFGCKKALYFIKSLLIPKIRLSVERLNEEIQILEEELRLTALEHDDMLVCARISIRLCSDKLDTLREYVLSHRFRTPQQEITFFKEIKPRVLSRLLYHLHVYNIEIKRPNACYKIRRKYLINELNKLNQFFDTNIDFYRYYRGGNAHFDSTYFIRGKHDFQLTLESLYFIADPKFSTSHDHLVASIMANDRLRVYLEDELNSMEQESYNKPHAGKKAALTWTDSKAALIELIYALHARGVFDNGRTDIKHIAAYMEQVFNISLSEIYHTYAELRSRKGPRTKFLDSLRESLNHRMDQEGNHIK